MTLSVIIPVYNVAQYLRDCLDSVVVAVRHANIPVEVICVDDGSTDGSGKLLDEYVDAHDFGTPKFKVIHQSNAGVSVARNVALDAANGEWVMMLDGDDSYEKEFLRRVAFAIEEHPDSDCFAYGFDVVSANGKGLSEQPEPPKGAVTEGDDILGECPSGNWRYTHSSCDKVYRRSILEKYGIRYEPGIRLGEDTLFANKFLAVCGTVVVMNDEVGYKRRIRPGSAIESIDAAGLACDLRRFQITFDWWNEHHKNGLLRTLRFWASVLPFLGKGSGCRKECVDILLRSEVFDACVIPFLRRHGTIRGRFFSLLYQISPCILRRKILEML